VEILLLVLLCAAVVYSLLSIEAARRYLSAKPGELRQPAPISVLKPLSGLDAGLESNLRTFFEQDYADFEILFAVRDADDPAVEIVEKLRREYPRVDSRLLITGEPPYPNAKVFSLDRMLTAATHDLLVMSDSDTRARPDLLRTIAAEFHDSHLGVATCPYRALPGDGLASALEATGMNTDFASGVLVARMLEGMRFAIGPTVAARRSVLQAIGGFRKLKDYLAEDFMLGKLAAEAGFGVILSSSVIEHHIGGGAWRQNASHRLRWMRSTRRSRPLGYIGQIFTMTLPPALLLCAMDSSLWQVAAAAVAIRICAAAVISRLVLRARVNWALLAMEDLVAFAFWVAGFFGQTIEWRGRRYFVHADGTFESIDSPVFATRELDVEP
jgi:ceramide glucosyltransferase